MKNKLKIFYVSAEVSPFTQTGELADISGALPKYLKSLGHEIRLMMPNYKAVNERKYILRDVIRLQGFEIKLGDEIYNANAKSAFIPDSKVQIYFLDNKFFFDRDGLYYDKLTGKEFNDNALRFLFFSLVCLETLKLLYWQPDIIHCNDWQTALIPILLKTTYQDDTFFKNTKTLLSVHNYAHHGHFDSTTIQKSGLLDSLMMSKERIGDNMDVNFLEAGLENADLLTAPHYPNLNEITDESKNSIHVKEILTTRKKDVLSIINGIDEQVWNPEVDTLIPFNYSRRDLSNKVRNKGDLLNHFELDAQDNSGVISMISHFCDDKCFELLLAKIEQILKTDARVIILANFEKKHQSKIKVL